MRGKRKKKSKVKRMDGKKKEIREKKIWENSKYG